MSAGEKSSEGVQQKLCSRWTIVSRLHLDVDEVRRQNLGAYPHLPCEQTQKVLWESSFEKSSTEKVDGKARSRLEGSRRAAGI